MKGSQKGLRILLIVLLDCLTIILAGGLGLLVRFDLSFDAVPGEYIQQWRYMLLLQIPVTLVIFLLRRMYHYVWHAVSVRDVMDMVLSVLLSFLAVDGLRLVAGVRLPVSTVFISLLLELIGLVGLRCSWRFLNALRQLWKQTTARERILLVGAGEAGKMLLQEIANGGRIQGRVCAIIDDNPIKRGKYLEGVRIVGGRERIAETVEKEQITQIIMAIPSLRAAERKEILSLCQSTGVRVRTLPGIYQLVNGEVGISDVKDIQVEDLLGREPVQLDKRKLDSFLTGKTVLITGGGGSIGSELCRQVIRHHPRRLVILDIYENNAYDIQQELCLSSAGAAEVCVEIASVRDAKRVDEIVGRYQPEIVLHAAAHKHVPLMESCPGEAVKNNIFGTLHVVEAAERHGVEKFVMISTDKAVNPTNFMGATKRFCEMILQSRKKGKTVFCAVRFGNVLGSNGSVVPLFQRQIAAGGPVTITDNRIIRYFMTIPEAAQLVLEAGAMAEHGQIFVLDMGEPVKILTLAENLIRLSGLVPYQDIEIREVGLRPGEKLYEELLTASADLSRTENRKIFVEQTRYVPEEDIQAALHRLEQALAGEASPEAVIRLMKTLVPTYHDPDACNRQVGDDAPGGGAGRDAVCAMLSHRP